MASNSEFNVISFISFHPLHSLCPSSRQNGVAGETKTYRFRCWLRHLLCTDIRASENFACHIPRESNQPPGESGIQSLPIDWVLHTLTEITFSVVVPGKPTSLVIGTPAHQSFVDAPTSIFPMVALQLTESTLSDHVRAAPDSFQLCYSVSTEFTHQKEGEGMSQPLPSSISESLLPAPHCVSLSQNAQLQPFDLSTSELHRDESYAEHHIEVWLQRKSSVNPVSVDSQTPQKLAKVAHVFFSRAAPLPCARSDHQARSLNRSLAAISHVFMYERGLPVLPDAPSPSRGHQHMELHCQHADAMPPSQAI